MHGHFRELSEKNGMDKRVIEHVIHFAQNRDYTVVILFS